jgi:hypothetical protein
MTKTKKIGFIAGAVLTLGAVILPVTGVANAANTSDADVSVTVGAACALTGGAAVNLGSVSTSSLTAEKAGTAMTVTCNSAWALTHQTAAAGLTGLTSGTIATAGQNLTTGTDKTAAGFGPWTSGDTVASFANNTWGVKYSAGTPSVGTVSLTSSDYEAVPANGSTSGINVATSTAGSTVNITPTFGAKTDGSLATGTYDNAVLYTLTAS